MGPHIDKLNSQVLEAMPLEELFSVALKRLVHEVVAEVVEKARKGQMGREESLNDHKMLGKKEAAEFLGYSVSWLEKRIKKPGGPTYNVLGGRVKFPRKELLAWKNKFMVNQSSSN